MGATKVRADRKPASESMTQEIDRIDKAILRVLQRDASLSNVALAAKVHLSPPACLRRVERLKQKGLITGIVALLNPRALDAGMLVMIGVVLDRSTPIITSMPASSARGFSSATMPVISPFCSVSYTHLTLPTILRV